MELLLAERWSPYLAGAGIGLLCCLTFLLSDKPIGVTTAFARTSGMIERLSRGRKTLQRPYYQKFSPVVDWEWMLVLGILAGAFLSAKLSGQFHLRWIPGMWRAVYGTSIAPRLATALAGGVLMSFGARWAGGCTSGHGISGTLQLAVSSWIATACFFAGGILTAMLIY
ncbi:MAG: YeeE/YedE thiosulfate transporter family protein [Pseudomonadota bacterium]|jgi:hypothetical protein